MDKDNYDITTLSSGQQFRIENKVEKLIDNWNSCEKTYTLDLTNEVINAYVNEENQTKANDIINAIIWSAYYHGYYKEKR